MFNWYFQWPMQDEHTSIGRAGSTAFLSKVSRGKSEEGGRLDARLVPVQSRRGLAEAHVCSPCDTPLRPGVEGNQHRPWAPFIIPIISFLVCSRVHTKGALCCAPYPINRGGGATCRPLLHVHAHLGWVLVQLKKNKSFGFLCRRSQNAG